MTLRSIPTRREPNPPPARYALDLPINPIPLERARTVDTGRGNVRSFLPERSSGFRGELRWLLRQHGVRRAYTGDLELRLVFWRRCRSIADRGDLDNHVKAILDAIQADRDAPAGVLIVDDNQIVDLHARFAHYGPTVTGRIYLVLSPAGHDVA